MPGLEESPPFEILEHTADIGLRARGRTLEQLFQNAIEGLVDIVGARGHGGNQEEVVTVAIDDADPGGALVDLLNEVIYRIDRGQARIADVKVERDGSVIGARIVWGQAPGPPEGTELKAATYHQLSVEPTADGYQATVYFDV